MNKYLKLKLLLGIVSSLCIYPSYADNVIDDPALLYTVPLNPNGPLSQKISLKRNLRGINDLVVALNNISGINAVVKTISITKPLPFLINLNNVTLEELLNFSSKKLWYRWQWQDNSINFYALNPVRPTAIIIKHSVWVLDPSDKTLRDSLTKWCNRIGWQLVWNVNADYPIVTSWSIAGSFESAVNQVLAASQSTNVPLLATMHDENHVLEIYSDHNSN